MDVREKLVELLKEVVAIQECGFGDPRPTYKTVASYLISHGVTVQEWISVKDRLPENDAYIDVTTDGVVIPAYWHNDRFYAFTAIGVATVGGVTHWMPLPQPPKGE